MDSLKKKQKQLTIRMDEELYDLAQKKCDEKFGIGLSPLVKIFLKSFVTQKGVGFYVGDDDLCGLFARWLIKKRAAKGQKRGHFYGQLFLKDLYDLGNVGRIGLPRF